MKCLIVLFLLVQGLAVFGSDFSGYLILKDGKKIAGKVKMFYGTDKTITIYKNGGEENYKSIEIEKIVLIDNKDTIIYTQHSLAAFTIGKKPKKMPDPIWAYCVYTSPTVGGYFAPMQHFLHTNTGVRSWQILTGLVRIGDDSQLVYIFDLDTITPDVFKSHDKTMRRNFTKLIKKRCSSMVEQIELEKYEKEQFIDMLKDYSETCK